VKTLTGIGADTLKVTKKNGTAPEMDSVERFTDDGCGALAGADTDELDVRVTPAGAPAAIASVAAWPLAAAGTLSVPAVVGMVWTEAGWFVAETTGVVVTELLQLATINPPLTTKAATRRRRVRKGRDISLPQKAK
jgi:hypothetical protein